jgi:GABA(A) receptor-associated protein
MRYGFKDEVPFEKRFEESSKIREKYPDKIPCVVTKSERCVDIPSLDKQKYLVPSDLTFGQMIFVVRKRLRLSPEKGIFLFVNNKLPASSLLMTQVYTEHRASDGFLYITISSENVFG